jgi:hypothetical protein
MNVFVYLEFGLYDVTTSERVALLDARGQLIGDRVVIGSWRL